VSALPSFWLEDCGDDFRPRPALQGDAVVDVAIMGGGFSGLWTAYHLLRRDPALKVAIVERQFCGYGASGRNGGWCSPRFPVDAGSLIKRVGEARARATLLAQQAMVEKLGRICAEEGIDAQYRPTGLLIVARGEAQMAGIESACRAYERLGLGDGSTLLSAQETFARVHATRLMGGLSVRSGAAVHPGRLVRGLARAVERRGGRIYEQTQATGFVAGRPSAIVTAGGTIRARRAVVAAGEAYMSGMPGFGRTLLPISSMIVLSEPLTAAQWESVGWDNGESLSSVAHTKDYLTRTLDGRILFGSRGGPYRFGSRMPEGEFAREETFEWMREMVREWWPSLRDLRFSHAWGGYLGVPRDWMPGVSFDADRGFAQLLGFSGRGVTTSALGAELLAGLIGGWETGLESLPLHRPALPRWEREPWRWMGVRYVQNAFARVDRADERGRPRPIDTPVAEYLGEP